MKAADSNRMPPQTRFIAERIFDHVLFSTHTKVRLHDGRTYTVSAVDFAKRQISHHKNGHPYWVELNQIAAIS